MAVNPALVKKGLAWGLWAANLALIGGFWIAGPSGSDLVSGDPVAFLHAIARILGLVATFCALTQFILMGRVGWLEPIFGLDRLAIFHRRNGMAAILLILAHTSLITTAHFLETGALFGVFDLPYVWLAFIAEIILIITVGLSLTIIRKKLKFETWYAVHVFNYLAIALIPFHQLVNGADLVVNPAFRAYWIGLYVFVALNIIIWRFGMTLVNYLRFDFKVEKVVPETPTTTSVYIVGRHLDRWRTRGGQFVLVRFFQWPFVLQEHPFSLSMRPTDAHLRLTIRHVGDFTSMVEQLKPNTPVWVSGPFGVFTNRLQTVPKAVFIAGGIGITPIRSMIEERAKTGKADQSILLYGNRNAADSPLLSELQKFATTLNMPIHNVLSDQPDYSGEKGYIDKGRIQRLVPDIAERDVFLCGPPPMMAGVITALKELDVPPGRVHYERFSLHKT